MNDLPIILTDYHDYIKVIRGLSKSTCEEYLSDLKLFFKFLKLRYKIVDREIEFDMIDILDIDEDFIKKNKSSRSSCLYRLCGQSKR